MTYLYIVNGMTCNGCRIGVEDKLNRIPGVINAAVNLEKSEATIEMKTHISTGAFQNALGEKHTIYDKNDALQTVVLPEEQSVWK